MEGISRRHAYEQLSIFRISSRNDETTDKTSLACPQRAYGRRPIFPSQPTKTNVPGLVCISPDQAHALAAPARARGHCRCHAQSRFRIAWQPFPDNGLESATAAHRL